MNSVLHNSLRSDSVGRLAAVMASVYDLACLTLRYQNLGSSEARDPAKFTIVVQKDENFAVRGSHVQLQLGASDFSANGKPLRVGLISTSNRERERLLS